MKNSQNSKFYNSYFESFPRRESESRLQYYKRIVEEIKKNNKSLKLSHRTLEKYYPQFLLTRPSHQAVDLKVAENKYKVSFKNQNPDAELNWYYSTFTDNLGIEKLAINAKMIPKGMNAKDYVAFLNTVASVKLPVNNTDKGMHVMFGCTHIPFENIELLSGIINLCEDYKDKIVGFHIMGDFLDMLALSKHELNTVPMKGYSLGIEYERGNTWLDMFDSVLSKTCRKTFIYGNHCDRFKRHFNDINNSVYKDVTLSPTEGLNLKKRGYEVYENWQEDFVQIGKLSIHHGYFLGQNPCKQHLDRMKCSNAFVHSHRVGMWYQGDQAAFNLGCTADLESPGMKYASRLERMMWNNGLGICNVESDGTFQMDVIRVQNSKFYYGGKKY